ncbi:SCP2 sterol-binding domain-containing protein [Salipaludibacillus sp. CUR1]|uniref:SCP2 sterol-binding domain-containing protein n=1 Tax=Salipaludibacillus sp. CUR1 TaxID=2820003 RepID=UPI001E2CD782|nr:SCP2 sterol-binding domain-containing protein [Salipaludibacillus sp. CUR1]MCE7791668.1 SCP2 sterol-binding domain-containing protein [Salipaludibacillus sp. CUR1]
MSVKSTFEELTAKMNEDPSHIEGLSYVYQFNLSGEDEGKYQLKLENQRAEYKENVEWEPRLTLEMSDKNFIKLAQDDLNPTMAYMSGKLKVHGDLGHALKFHTLIKKYQ